MNNGNILTLIRSVAVFRNSAASLKLVIGQGTVFKQFGSVNGSR